jgi:Na+-translocating ferredoxin:NAD+ oxidoreductase RnfD subunit
MHCCQAVNSAVLLQNTVDLQHITSQRVCTTSQLLCTTGHVSNHATLAGGFAKPWLLKEHVLWVRIVHMMCPCVFIHTFKMMIYPLNLM